MAFKSIAYSPPAVKLLRTNDFPSVEEEAVLRASLASARIVMDDLDADLHWLLAPPPFPAPSISPSSLTSDDPEASSTASSRLSLSASSIELQALRIDLIEEVLQNQDAVQQFIAAHDSILSPLRRLPVELMEIIFLCGMEDAEGDAPTTIDKPPWVYSHVCHRWRAIALSLPALWCNIHVNDNSNGDGSIPALSTMLQRSQSSHLFLSFTWKATNTDKDVMNLLRVHASRWYKLTLSVMDHAFLDLPDAPSLYEFTLYTASRFCRNFLRSWLTRLPELRVVTIPQYMEHHYQWSKSLRIPWSQLKSFSYDSTVTGGDLGSQLDILRKLISVEQLGLTCGYCTPPWITPQEEIVFSHLKSLTINPHSQEVLLNNIVTPCLDDVTVVCRSAHSCINLRAVAKLVARSKCNLERLSIQVSVPQICLTDAEEREVMALLKMCPSLRVLHLGLGELTTQATGRKRHIIYGNSRKRSPYVSLLTVLGSSGAPGSTANPICPVLEELNVHVVGGSVWQIFDFIQVMLDILHHRWCLGALKTVHVRGHSYLDDPGVEDARGELLAFGNEHRGINVRVSWI